MRRTRGQTSRLVWFWAIATTTPTVCAALTVCAAILGLSIDSTNAAEVAWLAEVQTPPAVVPPGAPRLSPLLVDRQGQPIQSTVAWRENREELRREWLRVIGAPKIARSPLPQATIVEEDEVGDVVRRRIRYSAGPEWETEAYIVRPKPGTALAAKPQPAAIVLHSTVDHTIRQPAGFEGPPEKFFGLKLAQRGFACICPRNYLWRDGGKIAAQAEAERFIKQYPGSTGMAKMLHDAQLALDLLLAEPNVDAKHVTAVGHSLGAKEVVYLAAFDERVTCTVSSEGGIGTKYSNWDAAWYLGPQIRSPEFTREHHELLALIAPRPFLLLGGDSADGDRSWPFIEAALPVYKLTADSPARLGLLNHKLGHSVPALAEARIYEWIERYGR